MCTPLTERELGGVASFDIRGACGGRGGGDQEAPTGSKKNLAPAFGSHHANSNGIKGEGKIQGKSKGETLRNAVQG